MAEENSAEKEGLPEDRYPPADPAQSIVPPRGPQELTKLGSRTPSPHGDDEKVGKDSPVYTYFRLYKWHPFTELFCLLAEWFTPAKNEIEQRAKFSEEHKHIFRLSVLLDYLLLLVIVLGILAAIVFVMLRTVGIDIQIDHFTVWVPDFRWKPSS